MPTYICSPMIALACDWVCLLELCFFCQQGSLTNTYVNWAKTKLNFRKKTESATTGVDVTVYIHIYDPETRNITLNLLQVPPARFLCLDLGCFSGQCRSMQNYPKSGKTKIWWPLFCTISNCVIIPANMRKIVLLYGFIWLMNWCPQGPQLPHCGGPFPTQGGSLSNQNGLTKTIDIL